MNGSSFRQDSQNNGAMAILVFAAYFLVLVALSFVLDRVGVPAQILYSVLLYSPLVAIIVIGFISRTVDIQTFTLSGRRSGAFGSGLAATSEWAGLWLFIVVIGLFVAEDNALVIVIGIFAGYSFLALVLAPALRNMGSVTLAEFLHYRFDSRLLYFSATLVSIAMSYLMLSIGFFLALEVFVDERLFEFASSVLMFPALVILVVFLGGMQAVIRTQIAMFIPVALAMVLLAGFFIGQNDVGLSPLSYGNAFGALKALDETRVILTQIPNWLALLDQGPVAQAGVLICFLFGIATLPQLVSRFSVAQDDLGAKRSIGWMMLFSSLLLLFIPTLVFFTKLALSDTSFGLDTNGLPFWATSFAETGHLASCAKKEFLDALKNAACDAYDGQADLVATPHGIFQIFSRLAGLSETVPGLVSISLMFMQMAAIVSALIFVANSIGHDIYFGFVDRRAPISRRLLMTRIFVILCGFCAALGLFLPENPLDILLVALSISASALFTPLVFGVWWRRFNKSAALLSFFTGLLCSLGYCIVKMQFPEEALFALDINLSVFVGLPLAVLVGIIAALVTRPAEEEQAIISDLILRPTGRPIVDRIENGLMPKIARVVPKNSHRKQEL